MPLRIQALRHYFYISYAASPFPKAKGLNKEESNDLGQAILEVVKNKRPQSVQELLDALKLQGINEKEALKNIDRLQKEGRINLEINLLQPQPPTSYRIGGALWYVLTIACTLIAAILVFVIPADLYPLAYVRNIFGIAFVLFLPGFALNRAVFSSYPIVKAGDRSVEIIERVALSFGLSIGMVTILGLLLYYSPFGISFEVVVITLLVFTSFSATTALILENRSRKPKRVA